MLTAAALGSGHLRDERRAWLNRLLDASSHAVERLQSANDPYNEVVLDDLLDLRVRLEAELRQLDDED